MRIRNWSWIQHLNSGSRVNGVLICGPKLVLPPSPANVYGKKFFVMGGSHVCSDDFSKAQALIARDEEITEKTKLKKMLQTKAELREKGGVILVEKAACFE